MINTQQAKHMRIKIDIEGIIKNADDPREVTKKDGNSIMVCGFVLSDNSGEIPLTLWGDDINKIKVGDMIRITNGYTNTFKNEVYLQVGKYGKLAVIQD